MSQTLVEPITLVREIRPGDSVTILIPNGRGRYGQEWTTRTGKAVICSGTHAALNMGGKHGTPGLATPENIVKVGKRVAMGSNLTPHERRANAER